MKRLISMCIATVLVSSFWLSGCGGAKTVPSGGNSPAAKEESITHIFAKAKNLPGMSYDYSMTYQEGEMKGKMWVSGKKIKSEITVQNRSMISIIDGDKMVAYTYSPEENRAFSVPMTHANAFKTPDQYADIDTSKVKVLETAVYEGVVCKVVLFQENQGKVQSKMWVREDYGIPIRIEVTEPNSKTMVVEYKNVKVGAIPDATFILPAGMQISDMSEMMKQIQKP